MIFFLIPDSAKDVRFQDNPLFTGDPHVRFYAGQPLVTPDGFRIGTLCVIDSETKELSSEQKRTLKILANQAVQLLELSQKNYELQKIKNQSSVIQKMTKTGGWELDLQTNSLVWTDVVYEIYGIPTAAKIDTDTALSAYPEPGRTILSNALNECIHSQLPYDLVLELNNFKKQKLWVRTQGYPATLDQGRVKKVFGTFQDVTEFHSIENELALKDKNFQMLFSESFDPLMTLAPPSWKFTSVNNAGLKLFKVKTNSDFLNLGPWDLSPEYQPDGTRSSDKEKK